MRFVRLRDISTRASMLPLPRQFVPLIWTRCLLKRQRGRALLRLIRPSMQCLRPRRPYGNGPCGRRVCRLRFARAPRRARAQRALCVSAWQRRPRAALRRCARAGFLSATTSIVSSDFYACARFAGRYRCIRRGPHARACERRPARAYPRWKASTLPRLLACTRRSRTMLRSRRRGSWWLSVSSWIDRAPKSHVFASLVWSRLVRCVMPWRGKRIWPVACVSLPDPMLDRARMGIRRALGEACAVYW